MRTCYLCKRAIQREEQWANAKYRSRAEEGTGRPCSRVPVHLHHPGVRKHCGLPEMEPPPPPVDNGVERDDSSGRRKSRDPLHKKSRKSKDQRRGRRPKPKA